MRHAAGAPLSDEALAAQAAALAESALQPTAQSIAWALCAPYRSWLIPLSCLYSYKSHRQPAAVWRA